MPCKYDNCYKKSGCSRPEPDKHEAIPVKDGFHIDTYPACHSRSGKHGTIEKELPPHAELKNNQKEKEAA
jgi:hypothetical protein